MIQSLHTVVMSPSLIGRGIKRCFFSDFLFAVAYIGLSREQRSRKTKIGTEVVMTV